MEDVLISVGSSALVITTIAVPWLLLCAWILDKQRW